jgi:hypothetical protein
VHQVLDELDKPEDVFAEGDSSCLSDAESTDDRDDVADM